MINKKLNSFLILAILTTSAIASFTEKQIDEMVTKLNFKTEKTINTDIKDPFGYPEDLTEKDLLLKENQEKVTIQEKKIIIDYQGIIINKALINGNTYAQDDYFNDAQITKITPTQLFLKQNDFVFVINKGISKIMIKENQ